MVRKRNQRPGNHAKETLEISDILAVADGAKEVEQFLSVLLTERELLQLQQRFAVFQLVLDGKTQRSIQSALDVGMATVSRATKAVRLNSDIIALLLRRAEGNAKA
jgi:TrpR family trp operon transcriptional repressor